MRTEHVDVLIIGAGISGIGAAAHLVREQPSKTYLILEAREAIGGTWDLFRYPGIRSDSDLHTFCYAFKPWLEDKSIADGDSILSYIRETAEEYGVARAHPLRPQGDRRRLVIRGGALDDRGDALRGGAEFTLQLALLRRRLLPTTTRATFPSFPESSASTGRSSIPSSGPRTSTTTASAWW